MTNDATLQVQAIGEQDLLKRLQSFCPTDIVGDDAAVLPTEPGKSLVVTSDVLVDGVHFSDRTTPPEAVGWRSAAANLSDLAAMGALPLGITVGLGLPGEVAVDWVERLYQGMTRCLQQYGTVIVGGDVCRSPVITVAITAFGQVRPTHIMRRSTAQPGDAILVTGFHGSSRAGLELLLHPELGAEFGADDRAVLIQAHQYPKPRLDVLPLLPELPISAMDSSDGLADAIVQICRASNLGAKIDRQFIPIQPALQRCFPQQAMHWALYGGEDFELVLCLPLEAALKLVRQLDTAVIIGTVTVEPEVCLIDSTQKAVAEVLTLERGFQHFK